MITASGEQELIERIKSLSELELESLVDEIAQHVYANNMQHIIQNRFSVVTESDLDIIKDELLEWKIKYKNERDTLNKIRSLI